MLSYIRRRASFVNIVAVIALVFVMTGGAYAAKKYLITSTSQIKPSVLKSLQGKAGAAGKTGPAGPAGPAGPQGPAGKEGSPGKEGGAGKDGTQGVKGGSGPTGPEGVCSKANCTLPSGATETGTWSVAVIEPPGEEESNTPISFPIPLEKASSTAAILTAAETEELGQHVKASGKGGCAGTIAVPTAPKGKLCVYTQPFSESSPLNASINQPSEEGAENGYGKTGAYIFIDVSGGGTAKAVGTWAVTAP